MSDLWFKIKQIITLVVFVAVLSLLGMISGRPIMIVAYGVFFLVVVAIMFYMTRKRQRHFEKVKGSSQLFRKIFGILLMILALITPPVIILRTNLITLPETIKSGAALGIVSGVTVLFIALTLLAVYFINYRGSEVSNRVIGYILYIIAAIVPGFLMSRVEKTTIGIGSVYYVALIVLILSYSGFGLLSNKE
ncbi:MAG TPA: hypothetical protein PLU05_05660 [Candidatus Cloacimonas acidaminovorans]|nr:hypothetical protein [Candidatus Cloacimonas acidaminovorans]HRS61079.1 hypothetical protein [Candidatus Cloacimonas sp.]HOM79519.1 hypothetical protein [Candidatus Cloacimonas acidaminovorans]HOS07463.1 hypothetical protein [Candidatus Cloacimonas acidaminovorans]HOT38625.1 hypothetical protein [Candidatus Cloacimonas acidaminovorans]